MMMRYTQEEILELIRMTELEHFDVRTTTLGISLRDCRSEDVKRFCDNVYRKITRVAGRLVQVAEEVEEEYGVKIVNKRIAVSPIAVVAEYDRIDDYILIAETLDAAAREVGVDFLGGFSALVEKGCTKGDRNLIEAIPPAIARTKRVNSSLNVASTRAGINMDAVRLAGETVKRIAELTKDQDSIGCAKFVVFANAVDDNPFMAGAFHGIGEPEAVINVGISGPGVVLDVVRKMKGKDLGTLSDAIKRIAFKITRVGELIGRTVATRLGVEFGIVDVSLAPTPAPGDSVADIIKEMGFEEVGAPGSTAALALLTDAVKKGGAMASSFVGGLSGAFIPVSEDAGMVRAVKSGFLTLEKLEAMTSVCSVGLDMIVIPGDTPAETIAAIIADEMAIGVINQKTVGVRIIPAYGKKEGEEVYYGGLLGYAPVMRVNPGDPREFILRGGRIPGPIQGMKN